MLQLLHHFNIFTVTIMTLLIITEYLGHKWPRVCSVFGGHNPIIFSRSRWFLAENGFSLEF
jgi:hypothetical protein